MGDHDDGLSHVVDGIAQEAEHLVTAARVEVPGRLVGEHDLWSARERPGDGDALLLAAGELGRAVREPVAEADGVDHVIEPLPVGSTARQRHRQHDVLVRRQRRHEVERLEHEPDVVAPQQRELAVGERAELDVADEDRARGEVSSPARQCMSVDLPEPDGPMIAVKR